MKQHIFINAYKTLSKFENKELPLKTSYGLFKLKKALQIQWDFELKQEEEIFSKYHPIQSEDGGLVFDSPEDQQNFAAELSELLDMDVEEVPEKIDIVQSDDLVLSVADIEALDYFVNFK